jgi:hypothetical protein
VATARPSRAGGRRPEGSVRSAVSQATLTSWAALAPSPPLTSHTPSEPAGWVAIGWGTNTIVCVGWGGERRATQCRMEHRSGMGSQASRAGCARRGRERVAGKGSNSKAEPGRDGDLRMGAVMTIIQ